MLKIAVLGGRDTVMGFKALGLDVFPASGAEEAKEIFRQTDARAVRNLSPEEQSQLVRLLKTVTQNLEEETK